MKNKILTLILFLNSLVAFGYDVSFRVVEAIDSIDIPGVKVTITSSDSEASCELITDGFGIGMFPNLESGEYKMYFEKPDFQLVNALLNLKGSVNLGKVAMMPSNSIDLPELIVEGARVTRDGDQLNVIPLATTLDGSFNVFDVLRKIQLPGFTVNPVMESISVFGSSPVLKVNGVPRNISYINSLDPSMIARIEYQDNPGARYMQSGIGGVINIILKQQYEGGSVNLQAKSGLTKSTLEGRLLATYNHNASQFEVGIADGWSNAYDPQLTRYSELWTANGFQQSRGGEKKERKSSNHLNLNASYQYRKGEDFSLNIEVGGATASMMYRACSTYLLNGAEDYRSYSTSRARPSWSPTIDLYMQKQWGAKTLEVDLTGSLNDSRYQRFYEETGVDSSYSFASDLRGINRGLAAEICYSQPLGTLDWEINLSESYSHSTNSYTGQPKDRLTESRTYLGTSFYGNVRRLTYNLDLGISDTYSKNAGLNEHIWQPSVTSQLMLDCGKSIHLSLQGGYRPFFPSMAQKTALEQIVNSIALTGGNPHLAAYQLINGRLQAYYYEGPWSLALQIDVDKAFNPIFNRYFYLNDDKFLSVPINVKSSHHYNTIVRAGYRGLWKHIDINISGGPRWTTVNLEGEKRHLTDWSGDLMLSGYWGKWDISGWLDFPRKTLSGFSYNRTKWNYNLSVTYSLPKVRFTLYAANIGFGKKQSGWETSTVSPNYLYSSASYYPFVTNYLTLSLQYHFEFGRSYQKAARSLRNAGVDSSIFQIL